MSETLTNAVLVPIVIGLVELAKRLGLPTAYAGLLAVIMGVLLVAAQSLLTGQARDIVLSGLATGLAAAGLYSGTKALVEK